MIVVSVVVWYVPQFHIIIESFFENCQNVTQLNRGKFPSRPTAEKRLLIIDPLDVFLVNLKSQGKMPVIYYLFTNNRQVEGPTLKAFLFS